MCILKVCCLELAGALFGRPRPRYHPDFPGLQQPLEMRYPNRAELQVDIVNQPYKSQESLPSPTDMVLTEPEQSQRKSEEPQGLHSDPEVSHSDLAAGSQAGSEELCLDPRGALKTLPIEIILEISKHLRPASVHSLALTCRPYYDYGRSHPALLPRLSPREWLRFIQLLERDCPDLYFCHQCIKLHTWSPLWHIQPHGDYEYDEDLPPCVGDCGMKAHIHRFPMYTVGYHHARLVMNRHLYGPEHGLPLTVLSRDDCETEMMYKFGVSSTRVETKTSFCARIIDNELYLLTSQFIWHKYGSSKALRMYIDEPEFEDTICHHVYASRDERLHIPELRRAPKNSGAFLPCKDAQGSCPNCLTDYSITIRDRGQERGGWLIKIDVYQQFGACRSPCDPKWRAMADVFYTRKPRCMTHEPGVVRSRWSKADEVIVPPGGSFVGKPGWY